MNVIEQAPPQPTPLPGIAHVTWAGEAEGLRQLSLWRQRLAPGAATPAHRHDCDEVVVCESGRGELHIGGTVHRFAGGTTLVLPQGPVHQIFNTGDQPMELLGIFGRTPVGTLTPDGAAMPLPWRS